MFTTMSELVSLSPSFEKTQLVLTDPGHDVDDALFFLWRVDTLLPDERLLVILGPSAKVSAQDSLHHLHLNLEDPRLKQVSFVHYDDFMTHLSTHTMHFQHIHIISPQTAALSPELEAMRAAGLPNLNADTASIQGNTPGILNRFNTDTTRNPGVNLKGNEELIKRFNIQNKLMVVDTPQSASLRMTFDIFQRLPAPIQSAVVSATVFQMFSRVDPSAPYAAGLLSAQIKTGTNYNSVAAFYQLVKGQRLDEVAISDIKPEQIALAEAYLSALGLEEKYTEEQKTDVENNMKRMVYALDSVVPGIWNGQDSVFIELDRNKIEQDPRLAPALRAVRGFIEGGHTAFIPAMYDLKTGLAYEETRVPGQKDFSHLPANAVSTLDDASLNKKFETALERTNKRIAENNPSPAKQQRNNFFQPESEADSSTNTSTNAAAADTAPGLF